MFGTRVCGYASSFGMLRVHSAKEGLIIRFICCLCDTYAIRFDAVSFSEWTTNDIDHHDRQYPMLDFWRRQHDEVIIV